MLTKWRSISTQDEEDPARLLAKENVDQDALLSYAKEAADVSTRHQLPQLEFAHNHYGQPDVAMFDFTSMFAAEHASRVVEQNGRRLLMILVGDSLIEVCSHVSHCEVIYQCGITVSICI